MRNRQRDEVTRDVLQTAMGPGAGVSKIMFCACLSHSQAMAYLLQMIEDGLIVNDFEHGKRYYRTTPKGVEYLAALNSIYELLRMETKMSQM
ncbi:MAG: winged helix-turn-helix domain-containing protein [Thermoproteota archaeon]